MELVSGFSKLSKDQKIEWLSKQCGQKDFNKRLKSFLLQDEKAQKIFDDFSENTISNFFLPFGIAPNFLINEKIYSVPMVIEESSVVAAASHASKFWSSRGGFHAKVVSQDKIGHVHFLYKGNVEILKKYFKDHYEIFLKELFPHTVSMVKRGGGIKSLELVQVKNNRLPDYFQLVLKVNTCDAMGANFINTLLEVLSEKFKFYFLKYLKENAKETEVIYFDIVMSILSNYTPESLVKVWVQCNIDTLGSIDGLTASEFITKFVTATEIAKADPYRAVTHNKGIMNGVDAVILATGNDFRAVEACVHAYATKNGKYEGLSQATFSEDGQFKFEMDLPLSIGTVGGLTKLHPLATLSLEIMDNPSASELMQIIASVGLAQNFSAIRSLITTGIQKGHMKMHLLNILHQLNASEIQIESAKKYFQDKIISFHEVKKYIEQTSQYSQNNLGDEHA